MASALGLCNKGKDNAMVPKNVVCATKCFGSSPLIMTNFSNINFFGPFRENKQGIEFIERQIDFYLKGGS